MSRDDHRLRFADAELTRLYDRARADRWEVERSRFAAVLQASIERAPGGSGPLDAAGAAKHAAALHLEDLALACACADGHEDAWDHFVREHRPVLYRAADALDPSGGARELADSLYADLYGLEERDGRRRSLFAYYHGRSSLATWLRAVLAQRFVDRVRANRRLEPLDDPNGGERAVQPAPDPDRARHGEIIRQALTLVIARLDPRDRLRLSCYYGQQLTLAQTGRVLGEHEATASRQIARTRKAIRSEVERELRARDLDEAGIAACFAAAVEDAGPFDLNAVLAAAGERKDSPGERS